MLCLYHLDDDGKCAAAVVRFFGKHDEYPDVFVETNYGRDVPFDKIHENEVVYIVDFSIEPEDMLKLLEITKNVFWIDHHMTAIQKYDDFPKSVKGIRCTDCSGCMLTYLYLTNNLHLCERAALGMLDRKDVPQIIRYCDDYDMWTFREYCTKEFHLGFGTVPHDPTENIWKLLLEIEPDANYSINQIIDKGEVIVKYRGQLMKELIESYGWESKFEGYKCYVLNQGLISSDDFDSIDVSNYDILIGVIWDGSKWIYSLRSETIDVGSIARSHGGGGHKAASGFISDKLLV